MKKLNHPHIVRLYELIDDPHNDQLFLVMELMAQGPVMNIDENSCQCKSPPVPEAQARKFVSHMLSGLQYSFVFCVFSMPFCCFSH